MTYQSAGVGFVGLYLSFPILRNDRRTNILTRLLDLEDHLQFQGIRYRKFPEKPKLARFNEETMREIVESLASGKIDSLQLLPYWKNDEWIRSYETSIKLDWTSSFIEKPVERPPALAGKPMRNSGTMIIAYPKSRFGLDAESFFQARLMTFLRLLFSREEVNWIFMNQGFRPIRPPSIGTDDVFLETRTEFPLTSFDVDLFAGSSLFHDYVKGGFWANFLNSTHVDSLNGIARILLEKPVRVVEDLGHGRVLLQVGPSPLVKDVTNEIPEYQRLRAFLKPILKETPEEWLRLRDEVFGLTSPRGKNEAP